MNRFLVKLDRRLHCPMSIASPKESRLWEECSMAVPNGRAFRVRMLERPRSQRFGPEISVGDEVWVWTHERINSGRGWCLTARAIVSEVVARRPLKQIKLQEVQLLERLYGARVVGGSVTGSRLLDEIDDHQNRLVYHIEDEDYDDFIAVVKGHAAPRPNEVQDANVDDWAHAIELYEQSLIEGLETRRTAPLKERPHQTEFRNELFKLYSGQCVVSGCVVEEAIEAAHIMPHTGDPVWDRPENGLLLRRDLHSMFDAFLWSINPATGMLHLSERLKQSGYTKLHRREIAHKAAPELLRVHYQKFRKHEEEQMSEVSSK